MHHLAVKKIKTQMLKFFQGGTLKILGIKLKF